MQDWPEQDCLKMVERPRPNKMDNNIFPNSEFKRRLILMLIFWGGVVELRGNRFEERGKEGYIIWIYIKIVYKKYTLKIR